jgi:tRNA 2-thiocytidine biosynthesis protein TtcA
LVAVNMDQKQPDFPSHILPKYLDNLGVNYKIIERDTYSIVIDKTPVGKTLCTLCSRLRRGTLYTAAKELGCNKMALGHHRNDILETFFLNLFFAGKLEAMPPKFRNDAGDVVVIRPLAFCDEDDISAYSKMMEFPIIPCNLCGSQENMQRKKVKQMMKDWEQTFPDRDSVMFTAIQNIYPSHLLDTKLYDFQQLATKVVEPEDLCGS